MYQHDHNRLTQVIIRLGKQPLVQFILIGTLLFLLNSALGHSSLNFSKPIISVSQGQIEQLTKRFSLISGRLPNQSELMLLVNDFIEEEVAYREALALNLDVDDTIVRRRLRQKINFLATNSQPVPPPSADQLTHWFEQHKHRYQLPERIAFEQVLLSHDLHGKQAQEKASNMLEALHQDPSKIVTGDPSMLPESMPLSDQAEVEKVFGEPFARLVFANKNPQWFGPIESTYGFHLVNLKAYAPSYTKDLEQFRGRISMDWQAEQHERAKQHYMNQLKSGYAIHVDWPEGHTN